MEKLVLDGKEYVKVSRAAKDLGYTSDYVGQLCRSGKVSAHLVGRTWYVLAEELSEHKVTKKRSSRIKAREQAKKSIEEHKIKVGQSEKTRYVHVPVRYENDDAELIPSTRTLSVVSEGIKKDSTKPYFEDRLPNEPDFQIENEGKKVIMSGDIAVVDVTDIPDDPDLVRMTPKIITEPPNAKGIKYRDKKITEIISFEEKLNKIETTEVQAKFNPHSHSIVPQEKVVSQVYSSVDGKKKYSGSIIPYVLFIAVCIAIGIATLGLSISIYYTHDEYMRMGYNFEMHEIIDAYEIIKLKI